MIQFNLINSVQTKASGMKRDLMEKNQHEIKYKLYFTSEEPTELDFFIILHNKQP